MLAACSAAGGCSRWRQLVWMDSIRVNERGTAVALNTRPVAARHASPCGRVKRRVGTTDVVAVQLHGQTPGGVHWGGVTAGRGDGGMLVVVARACRQRFRDSGLLEHLGFRHSPLHELRGRDVVLRFACPTQNLKTVLVVFARCTEPLCTRAGVVASMLAPTRKLLRGRPSTQWRASRV